jgi:hypothetical protein
MMGSQDTPNSRAETSRIAHEAVTDRRSVLSGGNEAAIMIFQND